MFVFRQVGPRQPAHEHDGQRRPRGARLHCRHLCLLEVSHYLHGVWNWQFLPPLTISTTAQQCLPLYRLGRRFSLSSFMAFAGLALLLTEATDNQTAKVEYILLHLL